MFPWHTLPLQIYVLSAKDDVQSGINTIGKNVICNET